MSRKRESIFKPASKKQALMLQRAMDTQVLVIGGASKPCGSVIPC